MRLGANFSHLKSSLLQEWIVLSKLKCFRLPSPRWGGREPSRDSCCPCANNAVWAPFLPGSAYLFFHPSSTRQHTRPLTHTSKVNPVQVSKLSIRKVSWLYEGNIHTWIWVKSPLSTFPTWVWAPEGCQVCILSREHEAAYQQWLRPCIGHPKKMLANFRPFQLGCNQLFFFF